MRMYEEAVHYKRQQELRLTGEPTQVPKPSTRRQPPEGDMAAGAAEAMAPAAAAAAASP